MEALAQDKAKVNMQLGWIAGGNQIGEVAAKQLGYYATEGIDFAIQPGGPNGAPGSVNPAWAAMESLKLGQGNTEKAYEGIVAGGTAARSACCRLRSPLLISMMPSDGPWRAVLGPLSLLPCLLPFASCPHATYARDTSETPAAAPAPCFPVSAFTTSPSRRAALAVVPPANGGEGANDGEGGGKAAAAAGVRLFSGELALAAGDKGAASAAAPAPAASAAAPGSNNVHQS